MKISFKWFFLAFLADLLSLFILSDAVGALWAMAWVLFAMVLGVLVIVDAGDTLSSLGGVFATPSERMDAIRSTPWMLLVGVLLFLPGVLSDILAVLLWLPSARRRLFKKPVATTQTTYDAHYEETHTSSEPHRPVLLEGQFIEKDANKHH
jgi:UPF0716 protein FxsA